MERSVALSIDPIHAQKLHREGQDHPAAIRVFCTMRPKILFDENSSILLMLGQRLNAVKFGSCGWRDCWQSSRL